MLSREKSVRKAALLNMVRFTMILKEIEIVTKNGTLLFDNQRDIEKYRILAYKTYSIYVLGFWFGKDHLLNR